MHRSLVVLCIIAVLVALGAGHAYAAADRSFVSGNFFLNLDGVKCGFVKSVDGGAISAEVINEPSGPSYFVKKHIGQPKYEEFVAYIGLSMASPIYDWIAQCWKGQYQRKSGSVVSLNYQMEAKSERQFTQALITETTIPACDGASKEPAYITVRFAPETTQVVAGDGTKPTAGYGRNEQKVWLPSNFRLTVDGLDCTKVNKIDSFTVKQSVTTDDIGDARDYQKEPGKLEFPNLKITLAEESAQSWLDWHKDFVINGNNDEDKEKNGTLVFLDSTRQKELLRIKFFNLGICELVNDKAETNADQIKRVSATLYCERMEFEYVGGWASTDSGSATSTSTPADSTTPDNTAEAAHQPTEDCQLGVNYSVGVQNPINLTVNRVEYTAERRKVGNEYRRPEIGEKMVVVHYTLQNTAKTDVPVGSTRIDWTLTDSAGVAHFHDRYAGVEESQTVLSQPLPPGQSVNCFICFRMSAKGQVVKLVGASHGETKGSAVYRLDGKVDALPDPYLEPEDRTGSTRRPVIPGKMGEPYQVLDYDIKVDSTESTDQQILTSKLPEGQKYLLLTLEYTNFTGAGYSVNGSNVEVSDTDDVSYTSRGAMAVGSFRLVTPKPEPEATVKFRTVYQVPKDFKMQSINIKQSGRTVVRIDQFGSRGITTPVSRRSAG